MPCMFLQRIVDNDDDDGVQDNKTKSKEEPIWKVACNVPIGYAWLAIG